MRKAIDIGGINYTIMEADDVFDADGAHFGQADYKNAIIKICRDMTPDVKEATLYHEITHVILTHIGEYEKSNDEKFVQNFSMALYNTLSIGGRFRILTTCPMCTDCPKNCPIQEGVE